MISTALLLAKSESTGRSPSDVCVGDAAAVGVRGAVAWMATARSCPAGHRPQKRHDARAENDPVIGLTAKNLRVSPRELDTVAHKDGQIGQQLILHGQGMRQFDRRATRRWNGTTIRTLDRQSRDFRYRVM